MRTNLLALLCFIVFVGCESSLKEYNDQDVKYLAEKNKWIEVKSGSVINESFTSNIIVDRKYDMKRIVKIDKYGHMKNLSYYYYGELAKYADYSNAPKEYTETIYPIYPSSIKKGDLYYVDTEVFKNGRKKEYYKDSYKKTWLEVLYDEEGNVLEKYKWENGKRIIPMKELFPVKDIVVGIKSYGFLGYYPAIKFRISNYSNKTDNIIILDYKFTKGNEIIDNGSEIVSSEAGWDYGMTQSVLIESIKEIKYNKNANTSTGIKVVVTYEDGSILYEGNVPSKIVDFD